MESKEFTLLENPVSARLQSCRIRNQFTDVIFKVGEQEFGAHRVVINDTTPVLKAMLSEQWSNDNNVLEFKEENIDSSIVEDLLDFFYTCKIILTTDNVHSICTAAHFLHIPELISESESFICENLDSSNVLDLFLFSDKLQLETLRKRCVESLFEHYEEVFKDPKVTKLNAEDLKVIMIEMEKEVDQYDLKYKESLFEALIAWFEYDQTGRSSKFQGLLNSLPLHDLSLDFLAQVVVIKGVISGSFVYSRLAIDAINKVSSGSCLPPKFSSAKQFNRLVCIGGRDKNNSDLSSVSVFDIASGKWTNSTSMLSPNVLFGGAIIGKKIYLCGGFTPSYNSIDVWDTLQVFDCSTNSWTKLQPMPQPRSEIAVAGLNEFIYVSGGINSSHVEMSSVVRYSVEDNQWKTVKPMQTPRYGHQLIELEGLLYAISSYNKKTVERYNPRTDEWTMVSSTQNQHLYAGAISHKGKIYVHSQKGFEVYSPKSNTWKTLTAAHEFDGCTLVSFKDKIWSLGGNGTASVYEFDTVSEQWTQLPDMDQGRQYHCSFAVNC